MDHLERQLSSIPKQRTGFLFRFFLRRKLARALRTSASAQRHFVLRRALASALAVIVLFTGTAAYAYASPTVARGNPLYTLKRSAEQFQLFFVRDPEARVELLSWLAERRLDEIQFLLRQRLSAPQAFLPRAHAQSPFDTLDPNDPLALTLRDMLQMTEQAAALTEELKEPKKVERALAALERVTQRQKQVLVAPSVTAKPAVRARIHEAFQEAASLYERTQAAKASVAVALEDEKPEVFFTLVPKLRVKRTEERLERAEAAISLLEEDANDAPDARSQQFVSNVKDTLKKARAALSAGHLEAASDLAGQTVELTHTITTLMQPARQATPSRPDTAPQPKETTTLPPTAAPDQLVKDRAQGFVQKAQEAVQHLPKDMLRSSLEKKVEDAQKALEEGKILDALQTTKAVRVQVKQKLFEEGLMQKMTTPAEYAPEQKPPVADYAPENIPAPQKPPVVDYAPEQKPLPPTTMKEEASPSLRDLETQFLTIRKLFQTMDERRATLEKTKQLKLPDDLQMQFKTIRSDIANFGALFGRAASVGDKALLEQDLKKLEAQINGLRDELAKR